METTILSTKLHLPGVRTGIVERPRLIARLDEGMRAGGRLTLVCAPAGFGKSCLLASWLHSAERMQTGERLDSDAADPARHTARYALRSAWVSLDASDNDPGRFWSYVLTALNQALPDAPLPTPQALEAPLPPSVETLLTLMINALATTARQGPIALVLDDYHTITAPAIHAAMTFLIDQLPPHVCLIITSRADPPLPLARWRARDKMLEIRAADLRFTADETARFFHEALRLSLTASEVVALERRTEGWVAGLQLALLAMQDRADRSSFIATFAGSHRFVVDYLVEEVVTRQPAHIQAFLLQTSILDRMCGLLCDAVLGLAVSDGGAHDNAREAGRAVGSPDPSPTAESYSQLILRELERSNLFTIPLDDERRWYRYHHLFAEVLRERLRAGAQAAAVATMHGRASDWFERHGFTIEAISHAIAAGHWERAARLIGQWAWPVVFRGQIQTVLEWCATLPTALLQSHPALLVLYANLLMHTNQIEAAEARLHEAEAALSPDIPEDEIQQVRVSIPTTLGNISFYRGDLEGCVAFGRRALERARETPRIVHVTAMAFVAHEFLLSGDVSPAVEAQVTALAPAARAAGHRFVLLRGLTLLAHLQLLQGRLNAAAVTYREAEQLAPEPGGVLNLLGSPAYAFGLGDLLRERNQFDAAEQLLRAGMERALGALTTNALYFLQGAVTLARLRQATGDAEGARAALDHLVEFGQARGFDRRIVAQGRAAQAWIALQRGDHDAALAWAAASGLRVDDAPSFPREAEHLTLARVLIARGRDALAAPRLGEAIDLLGRLLAAAEAGGRMGSVIEILALRALALRACGDTAGAQSAITRALALAAPEGYVRLFVDEGAPMAALLEAWSAERGAQNDLLQHYGARLLAAFARSDRVAASSAPAGLPSSAPTLQYLVEPLSVRELEVLRLVAAGHSNQAIADTLIVAVGTIKKHINNIYGKLEVGSRTQALARARELGLL